MENRLALIVALTAGLLGLAFYLYRQSIAFNPRWLWSKYRGLRKYIVAMAKHETGNFTSNIWLENNNAFGMKIPMIRKNLVQGENRGHGVFKNPGESLQDFFYYLDEFNAPPSFPSVEEFVLWLKGNGYFEDSVSNYTKGLKSWMN